ncbi:MAG: RNA 2',3'-cyclic phosphodiesterase [bacterium]|nr:RNA 2',3'-cyclic phosphodiesterase [bacterium]
MRLFFALWPTTATQKSWHHRLAPCLSPLGGHAIPAANLHLTLAFLGEVAGNRTNDIIRLGDDLPVDAIALRFDHVECWKSGGLACLRPAQTPAALTRLVGHINTGLQLSGFTLDARNFKPHVTLARQLALIEPAIPVWPVVEWQAPEIALVRSRLTPEGSEYSVLHEWPLQAS